MSSTTSTDGNITLIDRTLTIQLPSEEASATMAIRMMDWQRIKRRISHVPASLAWLPRVYPTFLGVAITAGLGLVPIWNAYGIEIWVRPVVGSVAVASLILFLVLLAVELSTETYRTAHLEDIKTDMEEIERQFYEERRPSSGSKSIGTLTVTDAEGPEVRA